MVPACAVAAVVASPVAAALHCPALAEAAGAAAAACGRMYQTVQN